MTLGPAKHEKVAIFPGKMSGFRMFSGFRERKRGEIRRYQGGKSFCPQHHNILQPYMLLSVQQWFSAAGGSIFLQKTVVSGKFLFDFIPQGGLRADFRFVKLLSEIMKCTDEWGSKDENYITGTD